MKTSIELPFFPGFYETDYFSSDTVYYAIQDEIEYIRDNENNPDLTEDDLDFDYESYKNDVCQAFVSTWKEYAPDDVVADVEFDELDSPRFYNFKNDRIFAFVELVDGWKDAVRKFMDENKDWLRKRVKDDWTSYDGFCSYMSNNFDDLRYDEGDGYQQDKSWYWHIFSGDSDKFECYLSTIIGYMMYLNDKNVRDEIFYDTMEDIYSGSYVYVINNEEK